MKKCIVFFLLALTIHAQAQKIARRWEQSFFGGAQFVKTDPSGDIYVTGTASGSTLDVFIAKFNSAGTQLWRIQYDGSTHLRDDPFAMATDVSGNVYVAARTFVTTRSYIITVLKYSPTGVRLWTTNYGALNAGSYPRDIAVDAAGNVIVVGQHGVNPLAEYGLEANDPYPLTLKLNASGVLLWAHFPPTGGANVGQNVSATIDGNGNIYVCGEKDQFNGGLSRNTTVRKFSPSGQQLWQTTHSLANRTSDPKVIRFDINGDILVGASSTGTGYFGYTYDFLYLKYSPTGSLILSGLVADVGQTGPGGGANMFLATDPSGNVYIGGTSTDRGATPHSNMIVAKFSVAGRRQWVTTYNHSGTSSEAVLGMAADYFNNVYLTGRTASSFLTIKVATDGTIPSKLTYTPPGDGGYGTGIALFSPGSPRTGFQLPLIYVLGAYQNVGTFVSYLLKYEHTLAAKSVLEDSPVKDFSLRAMPNPARDATVLEYTLGENATVNLVVYDVAGRMIKVINKGSQPPGLYRAELLMRAWAKGAYHVQLEAVMAHGKWKQTTQLVLTR